MNGELQVLNKLLKEGKCCASALLQMGLLIRGEENSQLVHAVSGLCGGLHRGLLCGALSGGCCMMALFTAQKDETAELSRELTDWFVSKYGGVDCAAITGNSLEKKNALCPLIVQAVYQTAKSILSEHGKINEE